MEKPKYLLDSNICIYVLEGRVEPVRQLGTLAPGAAVTSSIAYCEVLRGLSARDRSAPGLTRFFQVVPIRAFDEAAAAAYATLPFKRARFDRLIAAHALALGLTLVTNNEADFADVPRLRIENWAVA